MASTARPFLPARTALLPLAAAVLAGCASAPPAPTQTAAAAPAANAAPTDQVCTMEAVTGSRFIRPRCMTVQERAQRTEADKEWAEKATNDRPLGVPTR